MARTDRLDRDAFFARLEPLDIEKLRHVLWNLYWRGSATLQERIEDMAKERPKPEPKAAVLVLGPLALADVREFVRLVRVGAYMGGSREVDRTERSKWRFTFKRHVTDAAALLRAGDLDHGVPAMEVLLDLACECQGKTWFHSEDPIAAMKLVVSDQVEVLWRTVLERQGFKVFAAMAACQFLRWEDPFGWQTFGGLSLGERPLAAVLSGILKGADAWHAFATAYVQALDDQTAQQFRPTPAGKEKREDKWRREEANRRAETERSSRTRLLEGWHLDLLERLDDPDEESLLWRIARHEALDGPSMEYVKARLYERRQEIDPARKCLATALRRMPGRKDYQDLGVKLGLDPALWKPAWERGSRT